MIKVSAYVQLHSTIEKCFADEHRNAAESWAQDRLREGCEPVVLTPNAKRFYHCSRKGLDEDDL